MVALARIARPGAARRAVGLGLATACVLPGVWRVAGDRSVELQDLRGACRRALGWSARLGGAPVVALGPGAQLLGRYLPGAQVDPAGALAGGPGRQVIVVPLPAWLESAPAVRARLLNGAPVIRVLPGRESAVLLVIRDPAAVDADR